MELDEITFSESSKTCEMQFGCTTRLGRFTEHSNPRPRQVQAADVGNLYLRLLAPRCISIEAEAQLEAQLGELQLESRRLELK